MKAKFIFLLMVILSVFSNAQNEFITVWKPSNPSTTNIFGGISSTNTQIWFPGIGTNFNVSWEEVGFPTHNGVLNNVTSTVNFLIDFGNPQNPVATNATYKVKINNGNGSFKAINFAYTILDLTNGPPFITKFAGDNSRLFDVAQWGNINWETMDHAFAKCTNLDVSATDIPNLSSVQSTRAMFAQTSFTGNSSLQLWNTSNVNTMKFMFGESNFNQDINSWDISNVTDIGWMFHSCSQFNYPLNNWNTSKVTKMDHMFHGNSSFNKDLSSWDTSNVTTMDTMFSLTPAFNQSLSSWNLSSLQFAENMLHSTGLDCANYDSTLIGWSSNPATPNNINLNSVANLVYAIPSAVIARNNLLNNKNWTFSGDVYNPNCETRLSTSEFTLSDEISIYPNPTSDFLNIKTNLKIVDASITDVSGRLLLKINNPSFQINIAHLPPGNYILQLNTNEGLKSFKFIKK